MPAEFIALPSRPFCPFERYCHGFDPPDQLTYFSFLPTALDGKPLYLLGLPITSALALLFNNLKVLNLFSICFDRPIGHTS
jgi:hypothetical protein